jgi:membrane-associated protein
MEWIRHAIDVILHLNVHLDALAVEYGLWMYGILFLIVFCETGLVVTPFLPGDSLLFAVGALAAGGKLNVFTVCILMIIAAILGDTVNYWIGKYAGQKLQQKFPKLIKPEYIAKTNKFYERYGGKTIIIARFVPIVRTFAPFVAGIGHMSYPRFMSFNVIGALLWVLLIVPAGYFFGLNPWVQKNFSVVILAIIIISVIPIGVEIAREWWKSRKQPELLK